MRYATGLCVLMLAAACGGGQENAPPGPANQPAASPQIPLANLPKIESQAILERIKVLSSDEYEGRKPGTKGEELTVQYLETELKKLGLKPGNTDGTYIQKVPLVGITAAPTRPLTIAKGGAKQVFKWRDEVVAWTKHVADASSIEDSDLVFAGYGVDAPEFNWDDFKGVDVKGKTIIVLVNDPAVPDPSNPKALDPKTFGGDAMTYYGRWTYKFEEGARKGAAGILIVHETGPAGYPFSVVQGNLSEKFDLVTPDKNMGRASIEGWVTLDAAKKILKMAGQDFDVLKKQAATREFKPVPLGLKASLAIRNTLRTIDSRNVVGRLEGSDPAHKDEYVVYSAHWDHYGIGAPVKGDTIYNGAADNASGVGAVLEIARAFTQVKPAPRRSILFLLVTAEEQGLLGSQVLLGRPDLPARENARQHQSRQHEPMGPHGRSGARRSWRIGARRLRESGGRRAEQDHKAGRRAREGVLLPVRSLQLREAGRPGTGSGHRDRVRRQAARVRQAEARRIHEQRLSRAVRRSEAGLGPDGRSG